MNRRWIRRAGAAAALVAVALAVSWAGRRGDAPPARVSVTGSVEATQVDVSPRLTGRIVELPVREGQRVGRGQLLARLDAEELEAEAGRARAALEAAQAQLRNLEAGARPEEIAEAEARAARARAQVEDLLAGSRTQEIEQARAALREAGVRREWYEREFERSRQLFARDLIAAQEVDRARQAYDSARAQEAAARERVALLEAGPRPHEVEAARAELRAARERVELLRAGPRRQEVEAARARVAEARATVALVAARLGEARLHAPIDGVVLRRNAELGETVNPGVSILTLMDPADLWLRAYVPETEVARLRVGQPAAVTVDGYPGRRFAGVVSEIASEAEYTPRNVQTRKERVNLVFRIRIALPNPEGVLKPGLPADAEIGE